MRIDQIILPGASEYERKSQRIDAAGLENEHVVSLVSMAGIPSAGADLARVAHVAHVYASGEMPSAPFIRFPIPYVASADVRRTRWPRRRAAAPAFVVSPIGGDDERHRLLPEAVEDRYFAPRSRNAENAGKVVGVFARSSVRTMIAETRARIERFRDDVRWAMFTRAPEPEDLAGVDVWVDPAVEDSDFDGFVAEALVVGLPVVAARTAINLARLEQGRCGIVVPPRDANEMTHAILTALFKPEVAESKSAAARQTISKFRSRQRLRLLTRMYETLTP